MHTDIRLPIGTRLGPSHWTGNAKLSKAIGDVFEPAIERSVKHLRLTKCAEPTLLICYCQAA